MARLMQANWMADDEVVGMVTGCHQTIAHQDDTQCRPTHNKEQVSSFREQLLGGADEPGVVVEGHDVQV